MKVLLGGTLLFLVAMTARAQSAVERLDALFAPFDGSPYLHGGVLVVEKGSVLYHRAFGDADVAARVPNSVDSRFQTASLSKVFTATAVLQLADRRRVRLDDPVVRHLRDFPFGDVTLRHLLAHTSGLPDLELYEPLVAQDAARIIGTADVVPALRAWQKPPPFAPGTAFRYSNTNYVLLARLVEEVSGMSFAAYLRRFVFEPAGMGDTYVLTAATSADPRRVKNHVLPTLYDTTPVDVSTVRLKDAVKMRRIRYETVSLGGTVGDQNVISTTRDLHRFLQALHGGKLLRPATLREAWTPARLAGGEVRYDEPGPPFATRCSYGLGWEVCDRMVGHSGYNRGIATILYHDAAKGRTIVLFDNADGEDFGRKVASVVNVLDGAAPLDVDRRRSITREYGRTLLDHGPAAALIRFNEMRADTARYTGGSRRGLNVLGYDLLHNGYTAEALEPFRINVLLHPAEANVYDSFAEALAANGRTADAIAMYEKVLRLDPAHEAAKQALAKLRVTD